MFIVQVRDDVILQLELALQVVYVLFQLLLLFATLLSEFVPFILVLALFPARPVHVRFGPTGRGSCPAAAPPRGKKGLLPGP